MISNKLSNIIIEGLKKLEPTTPDIVEWCAKNFYISQEESFRPGFWSPDFLPPQTEILRAFQDPEITDIVIASCAQWGKTTLQKMILSYIAVNTPGPVQVTLPTDDDIKRFNSTRFEPMLRDMPILQKVFVTKSQRDKNNRANMKVFFRGFVFLASANNGNDLRGQPIRFELNDEVSAWPLSIPRQGSPVALVKARTKTFPNAKRLWFSTPSIEGDHIYKLFYSGDQRYLFVNCPACQFEQRITYRDHIKHDGNGDNAYFQCENCEHKVFDANWLELVRSAKFKATAKSSKGVASFHVASFFIHDNFSKIAREMIEAKSDPIRLQAVINLSLGEWFKDNISEIEFLDVYKRRSSYLRSEVPPGVEFLTIGADTQNDRIEYEVRGWNRSGESWSIEYNIINGDTSSVEVWEEFRLHCDREYSGLKPVAIGIDSGGQRTKNVYSFVMSADKKRFFALKGSTGDYYLSTPKKQDVIIQGVKVQRAVDLYYVGTDKIKMEIMTSLKIKEGEVQPKNYIHFPHDYDEEHFRRLCSEKFDWGFDNQKKNGRIIRKKPQWFKIYQRNEQLDCAVYNRAAFEFFGAHKLSEKEFQILTNRMKNEKKQVSKMQNIETKNSQKKFNKTIKGWAGNKFRLR